MEKIRVNKRKLKELLTDCGYLGYNSDRQKWYDLKGLVNAIAKNVNYFVVKKSGRKK